MLLTDSGRSVRPVIGFISTWPVYQGTTLDRHAHALMQGIRAAARDRGCDLLLSAGVTAAADGRWRTVWPVPAPDSDLVPVGPWDTNGLIVVPDDLSDAQSRYIADLQASGFPIVFTTPEAPGPRVVVDNAGGIRLAVGHLVEHGHTRIAFVAGKEHRGGDSAERLRAFRAAMEAAGLTADVRLIAYGEHRFDGGRLAMRRILAAGADFTAFVASNDLSCLGALEELAAAGRRVPDDVAAIGFDDILDARSHAPSLTTVRHPTFTLGYQAVVSLLQRIEDPSGVPEVIVEPTRLIVRRSCGCGPERSVPDGWPSARPLTAADPGLAQALGEEMAAAADPEARHATTDELSEDCRSLARALLDACGPARDASVLQDELRRAVMRTQQRGDDAHLWQSAVSVLYRASGRLAGLVPGADQGWILSLVDLARSEVAEHAQRQTTRLLLEHLGTMSRLGRLTSQLLAAHDLHDTAAILDEHLPSLGVSDFLACLYVPDDDDPGERAEVILASGLPPGAVGRVFPTRRFPPPGLYPPDRPLQLVVLPLTVTGGLDGFVAMTMSDLEVAAAIVTNLGSAIRASRLYQQAVEGRRLAEEASTIKSRFLSMVSHELRTPLSVVVGLSDLVLREARDGSSPSATMVADLERMAASAEHLGRLIGDVLDLASGESGQLRLTTAPLDLGRLLGDVATVGRGMAAARGLGFEADLPEAGPWVVGDGTRLRQVTLNLLSNAVKFTPEGSVALAVSEHGGVATVAVSDTGVGVAPDELGVIFTEFGRSRRAPAAAEPGLGLGLAIADQLVGLHGGRLEVRSPGLEGRGSTFSFSLPIVTAPPVDEEGPSEDPGNAPPTAALHPARVPRVLVVEDDPDMRDLHARIVAEAGARPLLAADGRDALAVMASEIPDLVLLDLRMAGTDGFRTLAAMRSAAATRDIPVIVITGQRLADADLDRLDQGVAAVVSKGVLTAAETRARIEAALAGRPWLGSATQRIVRRATAFIERHHAEPLTRELIAREVAISPDYLTDCFRQELGVTPMVYLTRCRIRRARELLETTDRTVTSVALAVGFSDVSHFTRTFHRDVGVSPRAYRRSGSARPARGCAVRSPGIRQDLPGPGQDRPDSAS
jgi:signal transduction histidine kinase/AraC-like DNA-binding protein/ABC-type sugar transport system substrate-binding protein